MRFTLEYPYFTYEAGHGLTFDGTCVTFDGGVQMLGFWSDNYLHVYLNDECSDSVRLEVTKDFDDSSIIGATIFNVKGMREGSERVEMRTTQGTITMFHRQECCERVELVDVCGDDSDLIGGNIVVFEQRTGKRPGSTRTYTFITIRTTKGDVTLRWGEPDDHDGNSYGEQITILVK
jgi:hypothetical protein